MDRSPSSSLARRLRHYVATSLRLALLVVVVLAAISLTVGTGVAPVDRTAEDVYDGLRDAAMDLGASPATDRPDGSGDTAVDADTERARLELAIHERVNEARQARDLEPIGFDRDLREIARSHSADMAEHGYFSHTGRNGSTLEHRYERFDYRCRVPSDGLQYKTGGENLFTMQSPAERQPEAVADRAIQGWLDSPAHRRNLLDPDWRQEGIGVARAENGRLYVTQNFC